ncbi:MAG: HTH domain-containing protein [Gilliamella sp.]|nr:HTH domain-containing protein [Gilliamella sp.]
MVLISQRKITVTDLAKRFMVTRPTIYNVLKKA